jgi:hypothetical protein
MFNIPVDYDVQASLWRISLKEIYTPDKTDDFVLMLLNTLL